MTTAPLTHARPHARRRFLRHYAKMVVAKILGMVVLGVPAGWLLGVLGTSWSDLQRHAPP